jgi:hypothetical protein
VCSFRPRDEDDEDKNGEIAVDEYNHDEVAGFASSVTSRGSSRGWAPVGLSINSNGVVDSGTAM